MSTHSTDKPRTQHSTITKKKNQYPPRPFQKPIHNTHKKKQPQIRTGNNQKIKSGPHCKQDQYLQGWRGVPQIYSMNGVIVFLFFYCFLYFYIFYIMCFYFTLYCFMLLYLTFFNFIPFCILFIFTCFI